MGKRLFLFLVFLSMPVHASATTIYLTSDTSWTVPSDWNSSNNTIEVIGGGGGAGSLGGGGGGGGAYSKKFNVTLTAGSSVTVSVGTGGAGAGASGAGTSGGDTYLCNSTSNCASIGGSAVLVGAKGGSGGAQAGTGGAGGAVTGIGTTQYAGGRGGNGDSTFSGAGGGAAGPHGQGSAGNDTGTLPTNGGSGDSGNGGAGGTGTNACSGTATVGSTGTQWDATHGSGGGGGSGSGCFGGPKDGANGGLYGGGGGAAGGMFYGGTNGSGAQGIIVITYVPTPSCSVWADVDPISYGNTTTLRWTSSNADSSFYITNVGYVTPNQTSSTSVGPLASTAYNGTAIGSGGTTNCNFTLTVSSPSNCTFNGSIVNHGSSVTAYQASTVPYSQNCVSEQRTCTDGTLSGTHQYASCAVGPQCTLQVNPTSIAQGNSSSLSWSSVNATSCTGDNFSTSGATSGSVSVSPFVSTTYTGSCTGSGGSAQCSGVTLTVTCTPSWTCIGADSQTISQTEADCTTQNLATCVLPEFCSIGTSVCFYNIPTGVITASPYLVLSGSSATISWNVQNATSCTVSGNGDTWSGTSGSQTSSAITHITTYTVRCDDADVDAVQDDYTNMTNVLVLPHWLEV